MVAQETVIPATAGITFGLSSRLPSLPHGYAVPLIRAELHPCLECMCLGLMFPSALEIA